MSGLGVTQAIHFVERDGYALLFCWVFAEQAAIPIPSIPLLIAVGAVVRAGRLYPATAIACCVAGALLADSFWFQLGRLRGKRVLRFFCRISLEPDSCVRQTENAFRKYGAKTLLVAKFIPGLNAVAAPMAGDSGIGIMRFLAVDALGIVIWSGTYMAVGYLFSGQLELVLGYVQGLGSGFAVLTIALFAAWIVWKFLQRQRFLRQIEGARITPEELHDRLAAGDDLYIVDLRGGPAGDSPSVPGAIRLSAEDLASQSRHLPRDREVILFCNCPNEASSAKLALLLRSKGISHVRPLKGGAEAWERMLESRI
jgi:membrane protein DedA with SNARE-associated domain/rhodanese-related sulfurtransferase